MIVIHEVEKSLTSLWFSLPSISSSSSSSSSSYYASCSSRCHVGSRLIDDFSPSVPVIFLLRMVKCCGICKSVEEYNCVATDHVVLYLSVLVEEKEGPQVRRLVKGETRPLLTTRRVALQSPLFNRVSQIQHSFLLVVVNTCIRKPTCVVDMPKGSTSIFRFCESVIFLPTLPLMQMKCLKKKNNKKGPKRVGSFIYKILV